MGKTADPKELNKKIHGFLGFDPAKHESPGSALFAEVREEIKKQRREKAKSIAKEKLEKLMELVERREKNVKDFMASDNKAVEGIEKAWNAIERGLADNDTAAPEETPPEAPAEEPKAG